MNRANGLWTVEMTQDVYLSQMNGGRVAFRSECNPKRQKAGKFRQPLYY